MKVTYGKAIGDALKEEMRRDPKVFMMGEDIGEFGNIFGLTRGMLEEFGPQRIRNTPITETALIGSAIGAAETGMRPIVELMYSDFTTVCFAEIFHVVAKWRYMHGPEYQLPLVIRNASGSSNGAGSEHSNCVESLFMHAPGMTIITPSCAYDAKGLLKSAIRSNDPVLFCEPKLLYQVKQEVDEEAYNSDYTIPIGLADVKREGKDVTLVAVGLMVPRALEAAEKLAAEGISVEVIDPRTIAPLDKDTIFASIRKTHRAAIVEESNKTSGIGAELAATFQEELYDELDGPVARIAALDVPMPYNIAMEHYSIPTVERIMETIRTMMV
jgi:pyruvate dehydrogenase E1 component beta subunit